MGNILQLVGLVLAAIGLAVLPASLSLALLLLSAGLLLAGFVVIREYERGIKFRFGRFAGILEPGLNWIIPFVETVQIIDTRVRTVDIPAQEVITKDNVPVKIDGVVYFKVLDPAKAVLNVKDYEFAVAQYAQTALKDVVGKIELDELLSRREVIAENIEAMVDQVMQDWGIDIVSVNLQNVFLPEKLIRAMSRQAEAEREKRASIIKSEGEIKTAENLAKAASILANTPQSLYLRTLYTLVDISGDPNQKIVVLLPVEVLETLKKLGEKLDVKT